MINTIARLAYGVNIAKSQNIYIYIQSEAHKNPQDKKSPGHILLLKVLTLTRIASEMYG